MGRGKIVEGAQLVGTGMGRKVEEDVSWNKGGEMEVGCPVASGQRKVIKLRSHCGVK
jgi:hypothetical protein